MADALCLEHPEIEVYIDRGGAIGPAKATACLGRPGGARESARAPAGTWPRICIRRTSVITPAKSSESGWLCSTNGPLRTRHRQVAPLVATSSRLPRLGSVGRRGSWRALTLTKLPLG